MARQTKTALHCQSKFFSNSYNRADALVQGLTILVLRIRQAQYDWQRIVLVDQGCL
jgi:hypothetical protein